MKTRYVNLIKDGEEDTVVMTTASDEEIGSAASKINPDAEYFFEELEQKITSKGHVFAIPLFEDLNL